MTENTPLSIEAAEADATPAPKLPPDIPEGWLTGKQAAERMKLPPRRFRDTAKVQNWERKKSGTCHYYSPELIDALIAEQRQPPRRISHVQTEKQSTKPAAPASESRLLEQAVAAHQAQIALNQSVATTTDRLIRALTKGI